MEMQRWFFISFKNKLDAIEQKVTVKYVVYWISRLLLEIVSSTYDSYTITSYTPALRTRLNYLPARNSDLSTSANRNGVRAVRGMAKYMIMNSPTKDSSCASTGRGCRCVNEAAVTVDTLWISPCTVANLLLLLPRHDAAQHAGDHRPASSEPAAGSTARHAELLRQVVVAGGRAQDERHEQDEGAAVARGVRVPSRGLDHGRHGLRSRPTAAQDAFPRPDKGVVGQHTAAELELKVALVYTKANDQGLFETGTAAMELESGAAGVELLLDQEDETAEEANARTKALLRREEQEGEAAAAVAALKQGDYQVQVHVIEARDLKGENVRARRINCCGHWSYELFGACGDVAERDI
ncbi:unnamed protein product [Phytophthora fragariaefolia]|uniref:Unnamed protein product n=1 Tax=Phytophthora fragariaefolia TaxID=1490495 RepID=A0A9W6TQ86_9STRA|nr:unnamed protein product [Phytophthora fragariaefolia]